MCAQIELGLGEYVNPKAQTLMQEMVDPGLVSNGSHYQRCSIDTDMKALAVIPAGLPSATKVMTVTPVANRPITARNSPGSIAAPVMSVMPLHQH